jgi:hypothetical protein
MPSLVTGNEYILLIGGMVGSLILGVIGYFAGWYK